MIYFVVAQKEDDGKWDVFGPWEYVEGADDKIVELEVGTVEYSQVELARVLTDEDDPDRAEWLESDKHEPLDGMMNNEED